MDHVTEAIVQADEGSRWLHMTDPVRTLAADTPDAVPSIVGEVERLAAEQGWFGAGFVEYEAAAAFGLATRRRPGASPVAAFALFSPETVRSIPAPASRGAYELGPVRAAVNRERFASALEDIHRLIADGDTYQVNYTFQLRAAWRGDPRDLFADLIGAQQGRYSAYFRFGGRAICSASPELFFARDRNRIVARPMKGTARRGVTSEVDRRAAERLRASAKERAENVMVVDMVRNDVGRVAAVGTVVVPALFALERYPSVWQMTSTIEASTDAPLGQLFGALFPSASVTGAPKVRTMEIIAGLESEPRGVYTGAVGYVGPDGRAQFNVAIRTAVVDLDRGEVSFGVGSGVLWDSDATAEYEECLLKGAILGHRPRTFELLETLRWTRGEQFALLDRHLDRLRDSAEYFGFRCPMDAVRAALDAAAAALDDAARVRLRLGRDGAVLVDHEPLPAEKVWRVRLADAPIDSTDALYYHKTTDRSRYEARMLPGCDDVILWNQAREVTESTIANVIVEIGGRRVTPPISAGLLPGTFRAQLLDEGTITERSVTIDEFRQATGIWLINSLRGWCRATLL